MSRLHSTAQPTNVPMEVRRRLEALMTPSSSSLGLKFARSPLQQSNHDNAVRLAKSWVDDLIKTYPGHRTNSVLHAPFYIALEAFMTEVQSRSQHRFRLLNRNCAVDPNRVRREYHLLRPEPAQVPSRTSTKRANRVMTAVEHTSKVLMVIGESAPVASPLKAAGAALERIVELAKTAKGNEEEAQKLSKHAEDIRRQLSTGAHDTGAEIGGFECALKGILMDLERRQQSHTKRVKRIIFAKDQKDELGQLSRRLDWAFREFSTANMKCQTAKIVALQAEIVGLKEMHVQSTMNIKRQTATIMALRTEVVTVGLQVTPSQPWALGEKRHMFPDVSS
ncbi:hypothetical protein VNI00_003620 [Paramarasmius palmivorus]|uniref:Uncharacterized protein n=1 Tax=Paramarasmius palmivorus TaxID=297713 RepID=A0AAW0DPU1_9AGAR